MLIAMAGLPGAGKTTIAALVGRRLGVATVSVDPLESAILTAGIDPDQPTGLAAYLVAETLADAVLAAGQTVIVDAVNAVAPAREQWVRLAAKHGVPLRFVEVECSDPEIHRQRLEKRRRNLAHLSEPTWHAVEQSLEEYAEWAGEAALAPRVTLDSVHPIPANAERAIAFVAD